MQRLLRCLCLIAAATLAPAARSATIVYVDATPNTTGNDGNTTIDGALVDFNVNAKQENGNTANDGLWNYRGGLTGNETAPGGFLWETDTSPAAGEITSPLATTIELAPGAYNMYGVTQMLFATYDVAYSLNGVDFTVFTRTDGIEGGVPVADFTVYDVDFGSLEPSQGVASLYVHNLGQVSLPAGGSVVIYIQGPDVADGGGTGRTRYVGVGYELVPEPSSIILIISGLILVGIRKRK